MRRTIGETIVLDRLGLWPEHLADLRIHGLSTHTIVGRQQVLEVLASDVDLADVTRADIRRYLARPNRRGGELSAGTRQTNLAHIVVFYRWCYREDLLPTNPCDKLTPLKGRKGRPRPIPLADFERAIASATPRVRVWLMLGAFAGLRCMESASLHTDDIDLTAQRLTVHGKGDKTRTVRLHSALLPELAAFSPWNGYLFPGRKGGHVRPSSVSDAVNRHLHSLGITHTAHTTRHRFASTLAQQPGASLLNVRDALGHVDVATTQIYAQADTTALDRMIDALDYSVPA